MGHTAGMVGMELPRDVHRAAKIAAVTEGVQLRDWVAEAVRQRLERDGAQASPTTKAGKAPKAKANKAEDQKARAAREVGESVMTEGKPVKSIAEPRAFSGGIDPNADLDAMPNPFAD